MPWTREALGTRRGQGGPWARTFLARLDVQASVGPKIKGPGAGARSKQQAAQLLWENPQFLDLSQIIGVHCLPTLLRSKFGCVRDERKIPGY